MAGLKNFCNKISYRHYPCEAATSSSIFEIVVDYTGKENLELSLREFILLDHINLLQTCSSSCLFFLENQRLMDLCTNSNSHFFPTTATFQTPDSLTWAGGRTARRGGR